MIKLSIWRTGLRQSKWGGKNKGCIHNTIKIQKITSSENIEEVINRRGAFGPEP